MRITGISATYNHLGNNQLKNQSKAQQPSFGKFEYAEGVMRTLHDINNINSHQELTKTVNSLHNRTINFSDFVLFDQVEALRNNPISIKLGEEFNDLTVNILEIVDKNGEEDIYEQKRIFNHTTQDYYLQNVGEPIGKKPTRSVFIKYSIPALKGLIPGVEFNETVPINYSDISGTLPELLHREEFTFNNLSGALEKIQKNVDGIVSRLATAIVRENSAQITRPQ